MPITMTSSGCQSPAQIVDLLTTEGSAGLSQVPSEHRDHTFTMITYEG